MKKRVARIIGLSILAPLCFAAMIASFVDGRAFTGRLSGFRMVREREEPFLYWLYGIGGLVGGCFLLFLLWKEVMAFREWRRFERGKHRLSGIITR